MMKKNLRRTKKHLALLLTAALLLQPAHLTVFADENVTPLDGMEEPVFEEEPVTVPDDTISSDTVSDDTLTPSVSNNEAGEDAEGFTGKELVNREVDEMYLLPTAEGKDSFQIGELIAPEDTMIKVDTFEEYDDVSMEDKTYYVSYDAKNPIYTFESFTYTEKDQKILITIVENNHKYWSNINYGGADVPQPEKEKVYSLKSISVSYNGPASIYVGEEIDKKDITVVPEFRIEGEKETVTGKPLSADEFTLTPSYLTKTGKQHVSVSYTYTNSKGEESKRMALFYVTGITKPGAVPIKKATISLVKGQDLTYTGKHIEPKLRVKYKKAYLTEGRDYTISYRDNIVKGKATATVTGIGDYSGVKTYRFSIKAASVKKWDVEEIAPRDRIGATTVKELVKLRKSSMKKGLPVTPEVKFSYLDNTLVVKRDYTISYSKNTTPGKAKVTIKGRGNYTGTISKSFQIVEHKSALEKLADSYPEKVRYSNKKSVAALVSYLKEHGVETEDSVLAEDAYEKEDIESGKISIQTVTVSGLDVELDRRHPVNYTEMELCEQSWLWRYPDINTVSIIVRDCNGKILQENQDYIFELKEHPQYAIAAYITGIGSYTGELIKALNITERSDLTRTHPGRYYYSFFNKWGACNYCDNTPEGQALWEQKLIENHIIDDNWYDYTDAHGCSQQHYRNPDSDYEYPYYAPIDGKK